MIKIEETPFTAGSTGLQFWQRLSHRRQISVIFLVALASRFLWLIGAYISHQQLGLEAGFSKSICQWDCGWYGGIINNGYPVTQPTRPSGQAAWVFFPMFPKLAALVKALTGVNASTAGVIVSIMAFSITIPLIYHTYRKEIGAENALFLAVLLMVTPISLYSTIAYTEAVYGAFLISGFCLAYQRSWLLAALCFAGLSATKQLGAFGFVPLLIIGFQHFGRQRLVSETCGIFKARLPSEAVSRFWLAIMIAPMGIFAYILYLHIHMGDGFAFKHVTERGWLWVWRAPLETLIFGFQNWDNPHLRFLTIAGIFGIFLNIVLIWKRRYAEAAFLAITIFFALSGLLNSTHRYIFAAFPAYLGLVLILPKSLYIRASLAIILLAGWVILIPNWLLRAPWLT
ncbi:MAG: hypothetical protein V3V30_02235 [Parvularculaceae bacterium]